MIAIGASAGGLHATTEVLSGLPADWDVPIVVVQHRDRRAPSRLCEILARNVALRVREAVDGEMLAAGTIHVGPPGHDVVFDPSSRLMMEPCADLPARCPVIDRLFASMATVHGPAAVAVVLTGTGHDGAEGVRAVHEGGGTVIVEDDRTAEFGEQPRSSIETGSADLVLPASRIGSALRDLVLGSRQAP